MQILEQEESKERDEKEGKKAGDESKEPKEGGNDDKKEGGEGDDKDGKADVSDEQLELQKKAKEYLEAKGSSQEGEGKGGDEGEGEKRGKKRKRKRTKEYDDDSSGSGSGSDSSDGEEEEDLPPGMDKKAEEEKSAEANGVEGEDKKDGENEEDKKEEAAESKDGKDKDAEEEGQADEEGGSGKKPRALHKTASIFLRNLAPTITKQEVEAMCRRFPGFLRAAISDPQPDRRWFRRGWITFERDVKIKEICYSLNNSRLRDCELGPIVNRDLTRRVRTVNGITVDRKVVRNDIKLAAKVITNLDQKWGLWEKETEKKKEGEGATPAEKKDDEEGDEQEKKEEQQGNGKKEEEPAKVEDEMLGMGSTNPVLENITDYLIEEASAEEEELLGKNSELEDGEEGEEGNSVVRDEELVRVLDRMLLYLRIVHSVDFYNHSEYPNEDEMPNRCGLIHARSAPPSGNVTQNDLDDYSAAFEKKMGSFLAPRATLGDDEAGKLGMKGESDEVEKFVQANTQELGKDKWLCPLSGKKFKGPDFVRKHIFNKHAEKVEEVKKEVQYYNNYLRDPRRPENPQPKAQSGVSGVGPPPPHRMRDGPPGGGPMRHGPPDRGPR